MNGRITDAPTPEERLAALARTILIRELKVDQSEMPRSHPFPMKPDYADFVAIFRIQLRMELLLVRIDEAQIRHKGGGRLETLRRELMEAEAEIAKQDL